ncbi:MAG TPA: anhydro-N-acetylmuramic acid kinase [Sulfurovum sp. UBA12169]|nr:MAG TPA: anhydro-N-acetylmuramic acid kinase [Sulfurovum sp. UBA12169]
MGELYIGVMSGTSLDGIDISLCEVDENRCKLITFESYPYELNDEVLEIIHSNVHISKIGECDHRLGLMYAKAINSFLNKYNILKDTIKAIGLHGQTVWHEPNKYFTMQLGDPNIVAFQTGLTVAADFRRKDMAADGQGAPFAPAFHAFLFGASGKKTAVVNIGGMANISVLDEQVKGYDTGCGNVLLDSWCQKHLGKSYDKDGSWARSGELSESLLKEFLSDEYFAKSYPKSTGREYFNLAWIEEKMRRMDSCLRRNDNNPSSSGLTRGSKEILKQVWDDSRADSRLRRNDDLLKHYKPQDIQRTLLELTAKTIANEVQKFKRQRVVLCGGGAKNSFLTQRLHSLLASVEVVSSDSLGISSEAMESMMMAWLAHKRVRSEKVDLKDVTGASANAVLGGLYV